MRLQKIVKATYIKTLLTRCAYSPIAQRTSCWLRLKEREKGCVFIFFKGTTESIPIIELSLQANKI